MKISTELDALRDNDIYSLMLFALYKSSELPEQSALSQLAYILDKDNLLRLCEFYGGLTIKIPTIEELETLVYSLLLFQQVDIEHKSIDYCLNMIKEKGLDIDAVETHYSMIKDLLKDYKFNSGRGTDGIS